MNFSEMINNNIGVFFAALAGFSLILFILLLISMIKLHKLKGKYNKFMTGSEAKNLESQILARFADIDGLKEDSKKVHNELARINENIMVTFQKIGVVKYDAFKEMGGKLSFVLALLDKNNNGVLLNSVHSSREGCYTYLKEIIKGESFLELSGDERTALNQAINSSSYME